jgi:hypothetical protein
MQARVKKSARYGSVQAFSGHEFVKHEWRPVPAGFEDEARRNEYLDVSEGKAEKMIVQEQAEAAQVLTMKARLIADYDGTSVRTLNGREFVKGEWRDVPEGQEDSARSHDLLEVWEAGEDEPAAEGKKPRSKRRSKKVIDAADLEEDVSEGLG